MDRIIKKYTPEKTSPIMLEKIVHTPTLISRKYIIFNIVKKIECKEKSHTNTEVITIQVVHSKAVSLYP
jgi:hypothetical protein